jgi:hypothetical protein
MFNASTINLVVASLLLLFAGATLAPARGAERHILLTNDTREPIVEVYVSDVGAGNWQGDLLGSDFLLPGKTVLVGIDDRDGSCRVDVKTVLDDGTDLVNRGVDVCRSEGYALSAR